MLARITRGCAVFIGLATSQAMAGSFSVTPVRIELTGTDRVGTLTIKNTDAHPLTVQSEVVKWTQEGGFDSYEPTRQVLVFPPIFTLQPGEEQIVRVALRAPETGTAEIPYRVFFQEVPGNAGGVNTLNLALRVGLPLFVSPGNDARADLHWGVTDLGDGRVRVAAENRGTRHLQVTGFEIPLAGAPLQMTQAPRYVLPGYRIEWTLPMATALPASGLRIRGTSDQGPFEATLARD